MVEVKKTKLMYAITGQTIREIVNQANELKIQRDDIVSLIKSEGEYILTYYS